MPLAAHPAQDSTVAPPLPENPFRNLITRQGDTYLFRYSDAQENLEYRYTPRSSSLHDLQVIAYPEPPFRPSNYGGPKFLVQGQTIPIWETDPG